MSCLPNTGAYAKKENTMKASFATAACALALTLASSAHAEGASVPKAQVHFSFDGNSVFAQQIAGHLPVWYSTFTRTGSSDVKAALVAAPGGNLLVTCTERLTSRGRLPDARSLDGCYLNSAPADVTGLIIVDIATVFGWFATAEATP